MSKINLPQSNSVMNLFSFKREGQIQTAFQAYGNSQTNIAWQICRKSFSSKRRSTAHHATSIYMAFPSPVLDCVTLVIFGGQPKVKWLKVMHELKRPKLYLKHPRKC